MAIRLSPSATRYRLTQLMHTFELKSKTLSKVPQGAYVRVLSIRQQQSLTALSVPVHERFRALSFAQIFSWLTPSDLSALSPTSRLRYKSHRNH